MKPVEELTDAKCALQEERKRKKLEKKQQKVALGANQRDESTWPKCIVWIPNRSRFCSGERVISSKYCINHVHLDTNVIPDATTESRKRVVCPIDPSHTVFKDKLEKHIKVCNKSKQDELLEDCPYFVSDFNLGSDRITKNRLFDSSEAKECFEKQLDQKIRFTYSTLFTNGIKTVVLRSDNFNAFIADKSECGATKDSLRHLYQQVSMISHMQERGMMQSDPVFIEFGAGRGMLSLGIDFYLNGHHPSNPTISTEDSQGKYLLIDMSSVRFKADRWLRHKETNFQRITGNIRDLDLRKVPIFGCEENREIVGIAKHLCGVATDYTIRCLLNSLNSTNNQFSLSISGICIATCCHHRCQWHSFVGKEIYASLGFVEEEWDYLRRLTSWTSNSNSKHSSVEKERVSDMTSKIVNEETLTLNHVKIEYLKVDALLGRMCKRIIDYCRCKYIEDKVNSILELTSETRRMRVDMVYYCEADDSLENCLILGNLFDLLIVC